jgi:serine/threonine protein kinase
MTNLTLDLPGKLINDRYYLYQLIADNNHNQVFLARDYLRHRKCIVKRLVLDSCNTRVEQTIKNMFRQEAKILEKLTGKHNQISQFYNYLNDGSSLYLVQEWVSGITLEQKLRQQKKLSEAETSKILLNLLPVLECIHSQGIIHRDIKPKNIVLRNQDNLPVLIDFGIAQQISDNPQTNCHQSTIIAGTPGYMSLEQAMGQQAYNNDLYSLGLTAIHLLTGRSPLNIDLNQQEISISRNLIDVLSRAIASKPQQRFASAREMRSALLSSRVIAFPKHRAKSRWKPWAIFLVLGIQVSAAWIGWRYLAAELNEQPPVKVEDLFPEESLILADNDLNDLDSTINNTNIFQYTIFTVGTSDQEILKALGEPVWRKPGFWSNSIAWSYENIVAEGIDLGYMFDAQTNKLHQAETTLPSSTNLSILQAALNSLLAAKTSPDIARGLEAVYQRRQTVYNFAAADLQGTIQRNQYDRIYIAVWLADFHQ